MTPQERDAVVALVRAVTTSSAAARDDAREARARAAAVRRQLDETVKELSQTLHPAHGDKRG